MAFGSNQTFEPRVGTAQLVFGIIYVLITLIALVLALYVKQTEGSDPWLHYFMAALFGIMAIKSFIIHARIKKLLQNGVYYEAQVDSCEPVRGITIIKGVCDVKDYGLIHIESRLVGESVAHEINRYMQEHKQNTLPALVVGIESGRPRGMFTVKGLHGHLIEDSAKLKDSSELTNGDDKTNSTAPNSSSNTMEQQDNALNSKAQAENTQELEKIADTVTVTESSTAKESNLQIESDVSQPSAEQNLTNAIAADELAAIEKTKQEQAQQAQNIKE